MNAAARPLLLVATLVLVGAITTGSLALGAAADTSSPAALSAAQLEISARSASAAEVSARNSGRSASAAERSATAAETSAKAASRSAVNSDRQLALSYLAAFAPYAVLLATLGWQEFQKRRQKIKHNEAAYDAIEDSLKACEASRTNHFKQLKSDGEIWADMTALSSCRKMIEVLLAKAEADHKLLKKMTLAYQVNWAARDALERKQTKNRAIEGNDNAANGTLEKLTTRIAGVRDGLSKLAKRKQSDVRDSAQQS